MGRLVRAECRREEVSGNDPGNGDRVKRWEALRFLSVLNLKAECQKRGLKVWRGLSDDCDGVQPMTGDHSLSLFFVFFFFFGRAGVGEQRGPGGEADGRGDRPIAVGARGSSRGG